MKALKLLGIGLVCFIVGFLAAGYLFYRWHMAEFNANLLTQRNLALSQLHFIDQVLSETPVVQTSHDFDGLRATLQDRRDVIMNLIRQYENALKVSGVKVAPLSGAAISRTAISAPTTRVANTLIAAHPNTIPTEPAPNAP